MSLDVKQIERAVLEMVVNLHPDHLTPSELVLKVAGDRDPSEGKAILRAVHDLRRSGLLRLIGDVVAPTHAALRAAALLIWP
jgi:hypothetical protein